MSVSSQRIVDYSLPPASSGHSPLVAAEAQHQPQRSSSDVCANLGLGIGSGPPVRLVPELLPKIA